MKRSFLSISLGICFLLAGSVLGGVPKQLNYQGILVDSGGTPLADTTLNVDFIIYDNATGGSPVWSEIWSVTTDDQGRFSVILGLTNPIEDSVFKETERYLSVKVAPNGEFLPRTKLVSVGYSNRVSTVDGATGGNLFGDVQLHSTLTIGDNAGDVGKLQITDGSSTIIVADGATGSVGIGTATPGQSVNTQLDIVGKTSMRPISGDPTKVLIFGDFSGAMRIYTDATSGTPGDLILGTYPNGHLNQLVLKQSSGNVGIGTATPGNLLHISAAGDPAVRIQGTGVNASPRLHFESVVRQWAFWNEAQNLWSPNGYFHLIDWTANTPRLTVDLTGNVGIGTTSPAHPLHMASGAHVTAGGTWTNASSREYKTDIEPLKQEEYSEILERLKDIDVVHFKYKSEPDVEHIGMIAEDVPAVMASPDRKGIPTGDAIAFLMAAVKAQQEKIEKLEKRLKEVEKK